MQVKDRQALMDWDDYKKTILATTSIDHNETDTEREKRIKKLEADAEEWFKFYFPAYCTAEPADFHKKGTKRLMANDKWYEVRAWSRELAKTARAMMEVLYMNLVKGRKNTLYVSNSYDNACNLLMPIMINLETNSRIINDYGIQCGLYTWEVGNFKTNGGKSFRAIGAGQSPRGTRNEEARPDIIVVDDIDTDEEARNQQRIDEKWKWIEKALIPTVSVSGNYLILFNGNIISKDSTIVKASKKASHFDVVNIRDKHGKSTWPQKNSEEDIDKILSFISWASQQTEYFNTPVEEGNIFKEETYGKIPSLSKFRFLVAYGDPSPSNKDNKAVKNKKGSYKAVWLVGFTDNKYYVIKGFLAQTNNSNFVDWFYELDKFVDGRVLVYKFIENNTLQDPFFEQVFKPLFLERAKEKGYYISVNGDERKKPDKFVRIEGNLEPAYRNCQLVFNIDEKDNPHMETLIQQFKAFNPQLTAPADGPDCIEGAKFVIDSKIMTSAPTTTAPRTHSHKYRY
jgi:hypothetical protein